MNQTAPGQQQAQLEHGQIRHGHVHDRVAVGVLDEPDAAAFAAGGFRAARAEGLGETGGADLHHGRTSPPRRCPGPDRRRRRCGHERRSLWPPWPIALAVSLGRESRHQLDPAGLPLVSPLLVTAGQGPQPEVLAVTAGLGHTVAGPLHLRPGPWPDVRRDEIRG